MNITKPYFAHSPKRFKEENKSCRGRSCLAGAVLAVGLLVWSSAPAVAGNDSVARTVTLLQLNDLHANLVPHLDLERVAPLGDVPATTRVVERGGVARIAALVESIRSENPDAVLMNIGDTYHGGVEALYTRGNAIVPAVDALGIDVGVPGNWDFAYGAVVTRLRYAAEPSLPARLMNWLFWDDPVARPNFPNLAANLTQTMPPMARGELLLPATLMLDRGGVSIGFIGLTSDIVPRMAKPFAWGFDFLQGEDNYRDLVNRLVVGLRGRGAEVVVVMSELGLHRDRRLADIVQPGVDVFFSAHTHEVTVTPLESKSGALVVESGNDGYLGRMDLAVHRGVVVERSWQLLTVDDAIAGDPEVLALVEKARAPFLAAEVYMELPVPWVELPLTRSIDTVVGRVDRALHRRDVLENPFNTMLAEVIRQAGDSQISMTPGFRFDAVVLPRASVLADFDTTPGAAPAITSGDITLEQVYRFLPIAPSLAVGKIRGEDLRGIIELELTRVFSPDSFQHSGGWLGSFGGLEIEVDLAAADGERVRRMILSGSREPIRDDQTITVTSCIRPFDGDDFMCSNPGYMEITELENPATGRAWSPLELLVSEFESGRELGAGTSRVHDQGGRVLWPHGPFIQPLTAG